MNLMVRQAFHLDGLFLHVGALLTRQQADLVRHDAELLRRCTQIQSDEAPISDTVDATLDAVAEKLSRRSSAAPTPKAQSADKVD